MPLSGVEEVPEVTEQAGNTAVSFRVAGSILA